MRPASFWYAQAMIEARRAVNSHRARKTETRQVSQAASDADSILTNFKPLETEPRRGRMAFKKRSSRSVRKT